MAIQTEAWVRDIEEVLFSGPDSFLRFSRNHDEFVKNKTVHVPQAGSMPAAVKNRTVLPATISQRTDTDLTYDLDNFTTDPILIENLDELQVSYAKRTSVMEQHINILREGMALEGLFDWGSDTLANQILTTGSDSGTNLAPGATGTRKKLTIADLAAAAALLDEQEAPDDGNRYCIIPPKMYYELFTIQDLLRDDIVERKSLPEAVLKKILGFNFIKRSKTTIYDDTATRVRKAVGAATATDDNLSILCWHSNFVAAALGTINVLTDEQNPLFYGDIISAEVNHKTAKLRTDEAGIVMIIQEET